MAGRLNCSVISEPEDSENSPENSAGEAPSISPPSPSFHDIKNIMASTSSPKRRRAAQKKTVTVPIKGLEGYGPKGEMGTPPSDSWAWRKYGQKPIKGSPYPRGYYKCSSSKGCPARKQVERSRDDPNMLLVTYSCEHNHPRPAGRITHQHHHHHHHHHSATSSPTSSRTAVAAADEDVRDEDKPTTVTSQPETADQEFSRLGEESLISGNEFGWATSDFIGSSSCIMLEDPVMVVDRISDVMVSPASGEEDESLFADLGELPECSIVFRRGSTVEPLCGATV